MQPSVRVHELSKQYRLGSHGADLHPTLRDVISRTASAPWRAIGRLTRGRPRPASELVRPSHFWALKDVSFEVEPGEVVGIVGRNGAGKSTLLKILSRVVEPTDGYCQIRGRLGSLLEVGTGFHPELTGRENIFLNGSILGMSHREILRKFDEIVAFAEIDQFLDTPVKRYSSGMYVRLAFAVAAHLEPEVLVVDEVLAVGDANFQRKCLGKMKDVAGHGRTILFVSHDMIAVRRLCPRTVLLEEGRVVAAGPTDEVVPRYLGSETALLRPGVARDLTAVPRAGGTGAARFVAVTCRGSEGPEPAPGEPLHVDMVIRSDARRVADSLAVTVYDTTGLNLLNAETAGFNLPVQLEEGLNTVTLTVEQLHLNPGTYVLGLWLAKRLGDAFDYIECAGEFEVVNRPDAGTQRPTSRGVIACNFTLDAARQVAVGAPPAGRSRT
jgi:lipopolysaccharide transport system ATP-binding protein